MSGYMMAVYSGFVEQANDEMNIEVIPFKEMKL